ncbi:hypothetical protein CspHIS471_0409670 [Cutaneotrichosporon sp. HIS471]|nr:hypothetical protein CspHIS471_0409670 [Cutaneotrichosporon sp. HIS471]
MKEIPAADKTFATIGAILWSIQVVPQIIKSYRTKSTDGLSPALMFIWACATIFQGSYLVAMRSSIPLQLQPQVFGGLGVISWGQCLYYGKKYSLRKTLSCVFTFYVFFAGFETGSVFALWAGERRGITWPIDMYGWITSALLILGLMPQYYEIYKHKEVVGISLIFMVVDISGGVFSGISLFFRTHFDSIAFVQYFLVVVLDGVVVILAFILNPMAKKRRAREAALADAENSAGVEDSTMPNPGDSGSAAVSVCDDGSKAGDTYIRTVTKATDSTDSTGSTDDYDSIVVREERAA